MLKKGMGCSKEVGADIIDFEVLVPWLPSRCTNCRVSVHSDKMYEHGKLISSVISIDEETAPVVGAEDAIPNSDVADSIALRLLLLRFLLQLFPLLMQLLLTSSRVSKLMIL
ncbi:hypothetical protein V6N13_087579 [Hibiscus sabdariffa]|uniref:Uncharacterized protein n=1 Tax=Hibiscus sabdariffa TaxID=183260 RepID=A0ABR2FX81_9ROSI